MNKIFLLAITLFFIANCTTAQSTAKNNDSIPSNKSAQKSPVTIKKGYYSIYRNAEKLNHRTVPVVVQNTVNNYTKGYYAISSKDSQLHKGGKSFIVITPKRRSATKGYYSIQSPRPVNNSKDNLIAEAVQDTLNVGKDEN